MPDYQYLIIGGGMTADSAVNGIRQLDASGRIGVISNEAHPPYNRPPLSKGLWKGDAEGKLWRVSPTENTEIHLSRTATSVDPKKKTVLDENGVSYSFQKLLLATGGAVRRLPFAAEGIIYFRTLDDYNSLKALAQAGQSFVVIGGGFIGSEIAAALALQKKSVTMIFPDAGIGVRIFPRGLSQFLNEFYRTKGVALLVNESVVNVVKRGKHYLVTTKGGKTLKADGVVAGIGIQPNVDLAQSAGLSVDNGIVVDEFLQTSHPDIFAAGDVANFLNPALGKRIRVEHEDNANTMGELAGGNMAGGNTPYHHLPSFYSDLFDLGYEAVGELDSKLEMVEDWKEQFREGIVYYLHQGRVRGVLLWNTWGYVDSARSLIAEKGPFTAENVKGRLSKKND
ncbi:MAG: FAD-dependent oxidoreductase [Bacteroidota bacterium]